MLAIKSIVFAVIVMMASSQAFARQSITCTGGHLYLEQTAADGSETCWETNLTCSGEWTYSWGRAVKPPNHGVTSSSATTRKNADHAEEARSKLNEIKESDLRLFYEAPAPIVAAFKRRAGWPTKTSGNLLLPKDTGPTFPTSSVPQGERKGYPPHGYPCLGCHPCDGSYCDNFNTRLTGKDLSPQLAAHGYRVKDGKIVKTTPK